MRQEYGPDGVRLFGRSFNSQHQLLAETNSVGDWTLYTYNSAGLVSSKTTSAGLTTTNIYYGSGSEANRLQTTIDLEIQRTNSYTYSLDRIYTHTDERGLTTTYLWDPLGRPTSTIFPDSTTVSNRYEIVSGSPMPNGTGGTKVLDRTATKDRLGHWTYSTFDSMRRMVAQTNALGNVALYSYCNCGALESSRDFAGNYTYFYYDNAGRLTATVYPDGSSRTNYYNLLSQLQIAADSGGTMITNWFNNQGLQYASANAAGLTSFSAFDIYDRVTTNWDANGVATATVRDDLGRVLLRSYPDGGVEAFQYSSRGLVAHTNQAGYVTRYGYDPALRKVAETNANLEVILYTNNAAGDLLSLTDGKNQTTRWNYDEYGRVTNKLDQAGAEILRYRYDPDNRLTNRWSAAKGSTAYTYDDAGNLTFVNYPGSADVSFAYDAMNRVTNMVDAVGITRYSYDAASALLLEDGPFASDSVTNGYQHRLRTALSLQQPTGYWTNQFAYDLARRLARVTSPAGSFTNEYAAGAGGATGFSSHLVKRLLLPNTSAITNSFDSNGRLLATHLRTSTGLLTNKHEYVYNSLSQRTNETRIDASTVAYRYDAIGQLKVADSSVGSEDRGYTYDAAWNLNYRTNFGASIFQVNIKNELTNSPVGVHTSDANGNLQQSSNSESSWTYAYDDENRLVRIDYAFIPDGGSEIEPYSRTELKYDGLGRLRKRIEYLWQADDYYQSSAAQYVYDGMRVIQERNASNTPTVSYTRGNDLSGTMEGAGGIGGLLARSHGYSSGNWGTHSYYHSDGNGNITYMLSSSQAMVARYRYDPFGNTIGISSGGSLANANVYRFSSKEIHTLSGLYYYGYRWYSLSLQRWLNRDPIAEAGGINLFGFVANNPVNFLDLLGLRFGNPVPSCAPHPDCLRPSSPPAEVPPNPALVPPARPQNLPKKPPAPTPTSPSTSCKPRCPLLGPLSVFAGEVLSPSSAWPGEDAVCEVLNDDRHPKCRDAWLQCDSKKYPCFACYHQCVNDGAWPSDRCPLTLTPP